MKRLIKKFVAMGLIFVLAISMASCGSNKDENTASKEAIEQEEEIQEDDKKGQEDLQLGSIPSFKAKDFEDGEVTGDIFAENELTVVNVWGTFCPPCIEEMPLLQEMSEELKDKNIGFVGICWDVAYEDGANDLAKKIVSDAKVTYPNILLDTSDENVANFYNSIQGLPTTIVVDKEGNIVKEPVLGSFNENTKGEFIKEVESMMENI